jgi:hypothetical protein
MLASSGCLPGDPYRTGTSFRMLFRRPRAIAVLRVEKAAAAAGAQ